MNPNTVNWTYIEQAAQRAIAPVHSSPAEARAGAEAVARADALLTRMSRESSDEEMDSGTGRDTDDESEGYAAPALTQNVDALLGCEPGGSNPNPTAADLHEDQLAPDVVQDHADEGNIEGEGTDSFELPALIDVMFTVELRREGNCPLAMFGRIRTLEAVAVDGV